MHQRNDSAITDIDPRASANGQPVAVSTKEATGAAKAAMPTTKPAQAAPVKQKVDRSQFVSKTEPVTAKSDARQTKFPLRTPGQKLFFRASSDPDARICADIIEANMGKVYVVGSNVTREARLDRHITQALLVPCINERHQAFIWRIKTGSREWYRSSLEMVDEAETQWIRIEADSFAQAYKVEDARNYPELFKAEPKWPLDPTDILDEALTFSAINDDNDPVLAEIIGKRGSGRAA
jgi:hypothetical protein